MKHIEKIEIKLPLLCAFLVSKRYQLVKESITAIAADETSQLALREALLQTYLFDGYPTALEGLILMKEILGEKMVPSQEEIIDSEILTNWMEQGIRTCKIIYGENYGRLLENVKKLSPALADWMLFEGYGKVLSRANLPLKTRELINIAILTVKDYPRQLHSHLLGALNAGVEEEIIEELLDSLMPSFPEETEKARLLWEEIRRKHNQKK